MATIDNLDLSASQAYAYRIELLHQVNLELRLKEADRVTSDVTIVAHDPIYSQLELAMGLTSRPKPYASFSQPDEFTSARRDSFTSHSICPSLGTLEDQKQCQEVIEATPCQTALDQSEKGTLSNLMGKMDYINRELGYILGRIGQYAKG